MTSPAIRIVTLNTWKNEGDYAARLRAMTAGLQRLAPDVVLLQECFRLDDATADTAAALAGSLGLACAYAPARRKTRIWQGALRASESGLAVLARGDIQHQEQVPLPSDERGGERLALLAQLTLAGGARLVAGCTHLSHLRDDSARRRKQLETILDHPAWRAPAALRELGGDFKAPPGSAELAWLPGHPSLMLRSAFDARGAPAATHPLPPRAGRPGRCIDFIFAVARPGEPLPTAREATLALDSPVDGVWPSDHAAIAADFVPTERSVARLSPDLNRS